MIVDVLQHGGDATLLSPKASGVARHVPDGPTAQARARASNDPVRRLKAKGR